MADGGGPASRSLPLPDHSEPENDAEMSSDFFLRPAHARLSRLPVLDVLLDAGERGIGLTVLRAGLEIGSEPGP